MFKCTSEYPKLMFDVFNSLYWKGGADQICVIRITQVGIVVTTGDYGSLEGKAILPATIFRDYVCPKDDSFTIQINLKTLVSFLKNFSAIKMKLILDSLVELNIKMIDQTSETDCVIYVPRPAERGGLSEVPG